MADEATADTADEPQTGVDPAQDQTTDQQPEQVDWEAKYKETLAHSRKHEQRAKENAAAAKELADRKAAEMTEVEKAQAAQKEIADRAEAAERRAALLQAIVDNPGLSKDDLDLLEGIPADQIDERAKKLAARITAAAPAGASGTEHGGGKGQTKPNTLTGALSAHLSK
ncbi:hypothetical protein [Gordonia sihwensis]|uniref:hypothetical protein n=1 Tax=Gordonia sihwensis TaxID=173559 RepID=UPI001C92C736|nr:hypothetical protein [Gordonia sihwensis]